MKTTAVKRLQEALGAYDAVLVSSAPNRFYLTGFETSDGFVFITSNNAYFLIDSRYYEKSKQVVDSCEVLLSKSPIKEIFELCSRHDIKNMFVENKHISMEQYRKYQESFGEIHIPEDNRFDKLLCDLRSVKSDEELKLIEQAQALTDDTFSYILSRISDGRTERDIMLDMEFYMRKLGSEGVSFDFIVVSGKNSSLPHGVPTDKKIEKGDFITMDFGAVVNGYRSDMTRTVALGKISDEQRQVYDTVLRAQLAAINEIKGGAVCKDIDKVARDIIYNAGYEGCFGHGLGHSVGIEIHERPNFNTRCDTVLRAGTVMTVEPGIYIENKFGVRIEDMVVVTESGCKNITKSSKKLICI